MEKRRPIVSGLDLSGVFRWFRRLLPEESATLFRGKAPPDSAIPDRSATTLVFLPSLIGCSSSQADFDYFFDY
jgi:hypothetical protein